VQGIFKILTSILDPVASILSALNHRRYAALAQRATFTIRQVIKADGIGPILKLEAEDGHINIS